MFPDLLVLSLFQRGTTRFCFNNCSGRSSAPQREPIRFWAGCVLGTTHFHSTSSLQIEGGGVAIVRNDIKRVKSYLKMNISAQVGGMWRPFLFLNWSSLQPVIKNAVFSRYACVRVCIESCLAILGLVMVFGVQDASVEAVWSDSPRCRSISWTSTLPSGCVGCPETSTKLPLPLLVAYITTKSSFRLM